MAPHQPDAQPRPSSRLGLACASGWYATPCRLRMVAMNNPGQLPAVDECVPTRMAKRQKTELPPQSGSMQRKLTPAKRRPQSHRRRQHTDTLPRSTSHHHHRISMRQVFGNSLQHRARFKLLSLRRIRCRKHNDLILLTRLGLFISEMNLSLVFVGTFRFGEWLHPPRRSLVRSMGRRNSLFREADSSHPRTPSC